jgi:hypothetical protein
MTRSLILRSREQPDALGSVVLAKLYKNKLGPWFSQAHITARLIFLRYYLDLSLNRAVYQVMARVRTTLDLRWTLPEALKEAESNELADATNEIVVASYASRIHLTKQQQLMARLQVLVYGYLDLCVRHKLSSTYNAM